MSLLYFSDEDEESIPAYQIVRFTQNGRREVMYSGLTLDEAQHHCKLSYTHGPDWFEGYESED